jgi:hypothetical protein
MKKSDYVQDGFNSGGYEWCIDNWGTKWNATDAVWVGLHDTLYFDTPWGPVFPIISEIHKRFPKTTIYYEYYESGQAFMGGCEFLPERDWDKDVDIPMGKERAVEMSMKLIGESPKEGWRAGQPYNFWTQEYPGYKGG